MNEGRFNLYLLRRNTLTSYQDSSTPAMNNIKRIVIRQKWEV